MPLFLLLGVLFKTKLFCIFVTATATSFPFLRESYPFPMKKTILFLAASAALLFGVYASYGRADTPSEKYTPAVDSLLNLMEKASGNELFSLYMELDEALYELGDARIHLEFNRRNIDAAKAAGSEMEEAYAIMLSVQTMYNYSLPDEEVREEAWKALGRLSEISGAVPYYFFVAEIVVNSYVLSCDFEYGLELARRFYGEAKEMKSGIGIAISLYMMGEAYYALELYDKAEASYREAISMAEDAPPSDIINNAYKRLVEVLINMERFDEALEACRQGEEAIRYYEATSGVATGEADKAWFNNRLSYAMAYFGLERYSLAMDYIRQAEAMPVAAVSVGISTIETVRFEVLMAQGDYAAAEKSLGRMYEIYEKEGTYSDRVNVLENRAILYDAWGRYDKATAAYKEFISVRDSLQRVDVAAQLNSIRTRYEVDKLEMQTDQQRRSFRTRLIWLSVSLVLLSAVIVVILLNSRRLRAKNRSLLERMREHDKLEQENEQLRIRLARDDVSESPSGDENSREGELYLRLRELMKDPAVYTDPGLDRRGIAEKLGTNERYVFDTIRKYYDMSVSEYITSLRLNYSRNLLAMPSQKLTIEAVALDSGFSSRATFHRLFRERFGMAPAEFRHLVAGS